MDLQNMNEVTRWAYEEHLKRIRRKVSQYNHEAYKRGSEATLEAEDYVLWSLAWRGRCAYCGGLRPGLMEHMVPLSRGGGNTLANVVPACVGCNNRKKNQTVEEWLGPEGYRDFMLRYNAARETCELGG